jgi:eukaryotic-like serine/threonine-protein kinase
MSKDKDFEIVELAELVADRRPVTEADIVATDAKTLRVLENLKRLDAIASVYQNQRVETAELTPEETRPSGPSEAWGPLLVYGQMREGGFGKVFLAYDPELKKDVALKFERAGTGAKRGDDTFIREAQKLAKVRHENVLTVHGAATHNGKTGIWTDLISGFTLEELLAQQGVFGAQEAAHIGIEICRALAAVHRAGLIHNDVKTQNVMRETGGKYVLMDFGAATRAPAAGEPGTGPPAGTPPYMAPEALQGKACNVATDVYALGVVLFRLVSSRFPNEGRTQHELLETHRAAARTRLRDVRPELPAAFVQIVDRAVDPDPQVRYRTAGEMEHALLRFLSPAAAPAPPSEKPSWIERVLLGALAVVGLALAANLAGVPEILRPFDVEASLFRSGREADERLTSGSRIVPGDQLFLEIKGSRNMHVYAINQDKDGHAYLLFPLPNLDATNPLNAGTMHRLPGSVNGTPNYWDVTSAGGEESIYIVASRKPVPEVESMRERLVEQGSTGPVEITLLDAARIRGISHMSPSTTNPTTPPEVGTVIRGLNLRSEKMSGLWVFEFHLPNPR